MLGMEVGTPHRDDVARMRDLHSKAEHEVFVESGLSLDRARRL